MTGVQTCALPILSAQQWGATLFTAAANAAGTDSLLAQRPWKASAFDKGAFALISPVTYSSTIPINSTLTENYPSQRFLRAFEDDKGATALMLVYASAIATADPDWERELLERVEIAPDALPRLAGERAGNVRAYLLQTGKVEAQRITESAQGTGSKGSRVYVRLQ